MSRLFTNITNQLGGGRSWWCWLLTLAGLTHKCLALQEFKDTTEFSCGTANLPYIIPVIIEFDNLLTDMQHDHALHLAIQEVICLVKWTLNWYYDKTDLSATYRLSMSMCYISSYAIDIDAIPWMHVVLSPQFKDQYFKGAKWPQMWQTNTCKMAPDGFDCHYKDLTVETSKGDDLQRGSEDRNTTSGTKVFA